TEAVIKTTFCLQKNIIDKQVIRIYALFDFQCFFFYCPVDHRDLHSFPTRRSSDLTSCESSRAVRSASRRRAKRGSRSNVGARSRSEEHTSELQSRGHLVCRLLLEKKKNR